MEYIDAFVAAVPAAQKDAYIEHARKASIVFREWGAVRVVECWGDDVPVGGKTSFPEAVQCGEGETVVFSWIAWPSKSIRDTAMPKAMNDPRMRDAQSSKPFDGSRRITGGFHMVLDE